MIKLEYIPNGLHEIIEYYGDPGSIDKDGNAHVDRKWYKKNISYFSLSFPLHKSWNGEQINGFIAHNKVGPAMIDAIEEIKAYGGLRFLRQYNLDRWGGVWNPRFKKGKKEPSTHMFGIAIDYCPALGLFGEPSRMPCFIVEAFLKRGFVNLKRDAMHFQGCSSY